MYSWLKQITYLSNDLPMLNDSTYDIAPSSLELFKYAQKLEINNPNLHLSDSI